LVLIYLKIKLSFVDRYAEVDPFISFYNAV